jgi:hypothetical protein
MNDRSGHLLPSRRTAAEGRSAFESGKIRPAGGVRQLVPRYLPCRPDAADGGSGPKAEVQVPFLSFGSRPRAAFALRRQRPKDSVKAGPVPRWRLGPYRRVHQS